MKGRVPDQPLTEMLKMVIIYGIPGILNVIIGLEERTGVNSAYKKVWKMTIVYLMKTR